MLVENRRKVLQDPATHDRHKGVYFGMSAEIGAERFLRNITTTSIEWTLGGHLVFAERDDQFPSGWNSNLLPLEARVCVNYYFDLVKPKQGLPPAKPPPK